MNKPPTKAWIEKLHGTHHRAENLYPDPLVFAKGYENPKDGELAGLVAAAFAYGQVGKIMEALGRVFSFLGQNPSGAILTAKPGEVAEALQGFVYRFHKTKDVALFFHLLRQALETWGDLGALFLSVDLGGDVATPLGGFAERILGGDARPLLRTRSVPAGHPVRFLLASPAAGGAAKRLCLFLRWMVRKDEIDPGYWFGRVDPARLVIPLDTHVARVGRALGFTRRQTADWKMAREITEALRSYDPLDPVRYDFSLFRHGMSSPRAGDDK